MMDLKKYKRWLFAVVALVGFPLSAYSLVCDTGNTYEINMCLIKTIKQTDATLVQKSGLTADQIAKFKTLRRSLCELASSKFKGGTYESVRYGHCVLSLTHWFLEELRP